MKIIGISEAKQKLSELVHRAEKGERIGISRRGKILAYLVPVQTNRDLRESFGELAKVRKKVRLPKGLTVKAMIDEGRP
jgi:prevent-host-death family protein